jgi:hypothetical protein
MAQRLDPPDEDDLQGELFRLEGALADAGTIKTAVIVELSNMRQHLARGRDRSAPFSLADVRIASPCKQRWADMIGDDRVRVCHGCDRPVFDLSEMTREEAEVVLAARGITPCVRFYRRPDGTVMTGDCRTGARRSRRLAVVAAGTALLGSSSAMADPAAAAATAAPAPAPAPAPASASADDAPATDLLADPELVGHEVIEVASSLIQSRMYMGIPSPIIMAEPSRPEQSRREHTTLEWSTWARVGIGIASRPPDIAVRGIAQPMPESSGVGDAGLGADLSASVAQGGEVRLGAWAEVRTSSGGAMLGGELIVEDLPPHPYAAPFDGSGSLVLRAGANKHVVTTAIGFGYVGSWSRSDPRAGFATHIVGVRVVALVNRSLDDSRDWSATLGVEVDPIGAVQYAVHRVFD